MSQRSRDGWSSGMLSSWKFVTSSSTSCPSATVKPNEAMIRAIAAIVSGIGCREPSCGSGPGAVGSVDSAAISALNSAAPAAPRRSLSAASMAARTSFAIAPIFGRSSAESAPIPRRRSVSAPRLPRSEEPSSSRAALVSAAPIFAIDSVWRVRSCFSSAASSTAAT